MREYLKNRRFELSLTQEQVAARINCTQQSYGFIENGNRQQNITLDLLERLAAAFDVPISEMIECENKYKAGLLS